MSPIIRRQSKSMEAFLKAGNKGRVLGPTERWMVANPEAHYRPTNVLHPSEISKSEWCPRYSYFVVIGETQPKQERNSLRRQNIFDEGHAIHAKWQQRFRDMGQLYGKWGCTLCKSTWWGMPPDGCTECSATPLHIKYLEVPINWEGHRVAGHADGWLKGFGDDVVLEIKSVGTGTVRMEAPLMWERCEQNLEKVWKEIKRPFTTHVRQAMLYCHVLQQTEMHTPAPRELVFLYESKLTQEPKEFVVPYSLEPIASMLKGIAAVNKAVDSGIAPDCPNGGCAFCKDKAAA